MIGRQFAFVLSPPCALMLLLAGCGNNADDVTDAAPAEDAAISCDGVPVGCDPYDNTHCPNGGKCTYVIHTWEPLHGTERCAPPGTAPVGAACEFNWSGGGCTNWAYYDNCVAEAWCMDGFCVEKCRDDCNVGHCVPDDRFFGTPVSFINVCRPYCDLLTQDCANLQGCYFLDDDEVSVCLTANDPDDGMPNVQGEDCVLLNECDVGYGCSLPDRPVDPTGRVCAFFCDATGAGGPSCADGPGAGYDCVAYSTIWPGTAVAPEVGLCVEPGIWE